MHQSTRATKSCDRSKISFAMLLLAIANVASVLGGTTYYYVGSSNVWNTAACYSLSDGGEGGAGIPGLEDSIWIAKGQTVYLDDTSIGFLNGVKEVNFRLNDATAYVHLENDFSLNCWFGDLDSTGSTGVYLVKTGGGKLMFAKQGTEEHVGGRNRVDCYNYNIGLDIREGSVQLEPVYDSTFRHNYKDVKMSSGTTLFGVPGGITCLWSLSGAGTVTNLGASAELRVVRAYDAPTEFSGILSGFTKFCPAGHAYYTGTESTIGGSNFYPYNYTGSDTTGITGFMTFAGDRDSPSSLGRGNVYADSSAFYLLYLGDTGETIERTVTLRNTVSAGATFDAGAHGGLVFTGDFVAHNSTYKQQRLVLTGSNTVVSVLSNAFSRIASNGTNCSFHVTKRGTGTWRFAENENRKLTGAIAVEDGTLEFESIHEAGLPSSLGYATDLYEDKCDYPDNLERVPYAYLLGGSGTTGVLRYIGTNSQVVTTRQIALSGAGRFEAPNCDVMKWSGVTAVGAGENSLAIWCAEGQTNHFANITNGAGVVSVAKDGPGDLILTGELSFGGDLSVSGGGTLTVRDISNALYRYYKLTLKETVGTSTNAEYSDYTVAYNDNNAASRNSRLVGLNEFGLYNEGGVRQNTHNSASALAESPAQLEPGHIAVEAEDLLVYWVNGDRDYSAWQLLNNGNSGGSHLCVKWKDVTKAPRYNDPETWISTVMRVKADADAITRYDLNFVSYRGEGNFIRTPTAFSISASADGLCYEELVATNDIMHTQTTYYTWLSSGTAGSKSPEDAARTKLPLPASHVQTAYNVLNNVRSVSVAASSALKFEGTTAPVVSALSVDASGMGAIDGFSFSANGALTIRNFPANTQSLSIPADFRNAAGLANVAKWDLEVFDGDGYAIGNFRISSVSASSIAVAKPGFMMVLR